MSTYDEMSVEGRGVRTGSDVSTETNHVLADIAAMGAKIVHIYDETILDRSGDPAKE